jgi:hypothetical protein
MTDGVTRLRGRFRTVSSEFAEPGEDDAGAMGNWTCVGKRVDRGGIHTHAAGHPRITGASFGVESATATDSSRGQRQ